MNNTFKNYFFFMLVGYLLPSIALAQTTVTFTNAAATGKTGPTQAQVNTAYDGTTLDDAVTINTQGIQEWTVPATATYTIEVTGASGGSGSGNSLVGGKGARMKGDFALNQGDVIKILVGQRGGSNGGAHGNENGGGGGTFVVKKTGSGSTDITPLIIAGGGGGGPSTSYGTSCTRSISDAHGQTGTSGISINCYSNAYGGTNGGGGATNGSYSGGAGGGLTGNGANGSVHCSYGYGGTSFTNGGAGGAGNTCYTTENYGGVGGGGGGN